MRSGVLAEFTTAEQLLAAVKQLKARGYQRLDAFTPWSVKGMDEALDLPRSPVARDVLIAGLLGASVAYLILWWTNAYDYPLIVGSRPPHAAPAFLPITFETTVLFAGLCAIGSAFWHSGLPRLWHPVFEVEGFDRAFIDRFWLGVDSNDPAFKVDDLQRELPALGALRVVALP